MNKIIILLILCMLDHFKSKAFNQLPEPAPQNNIYVSTGGSDLFEGTVKKPFRTIAKAVRTAVPGDRILVSTGTYRESVLFERGGTSENSRITLEALNPGKVLLKGSVQKTNWVRGKDKLWKCLLDSAIGELALFSNGKKMINVRKMSECNRAMRWVMEKENGKTLIWANFGTGNPNILLTEVAIRKQGINAKAGVDYITIKGINVSQIVNDYASIYDKQPGAIDTRNGKYWNIYNCTISECRSVGISIGIPGHVYEDVTPRKPEFSDYTEIKSVGHHKIKGNHISNCGQAGIFGLVGGSSSVIEDNLIENINQDKLYQGNESAGIRLAMAVDATLSHNLIRGTYGRNTYGMFLGPIFQGTRISRNIVSDSDAALLYLFKNHGPVLFDNNILAMTGTKAKNGAAVTMVASEANVFVQNLFYSCGFSNGQQTGRPVSTSNFLPHSLVIKQTIPALNIDHRWYSNLFIGKGIGIPRAGGCEADYNLYADYAIPVNWGDVGSAKATESISFSLQHHKNGVDLLWNIGALKTVKIPALTADFLGFFTLSKQYVESSDGKKITVDRDYWDSVAGIAQRLPGPFYQEKNLRHRIKLF